VPEGVLLIEVGLDQVALNHGGMECLKQFSDTASVSRHP
jgi:hypothetical protein